MTQAGTQFANEIAQMTLQEKEYHPNSLRARIVRGFWANKPGVLGLAILCAIILSAVFASAIAPHDPVAQDLLKRFAPPVGAGGTWDNVLGTDQTGRDVLSRIIYGARVSMALAFVSTTISLLIGIVLGMLAAYRGGILDVVLMRIGDIQLAMPFYVIAIAVVAVFGPSFQNLLIILSLWGWPLYARVARGDVLSVKEREFVQAARGIGAHPWRVLVRHILPNILSPLIVTWTFSIATVILAESGLSFLGLGVQPPTPAWGVMLSDGQRYLSTAWWLALFPGLVLMITILSVNLVGDALRDVMDPQLWR